MLSPLTDKLRVFVHSKLEPVGGAKRPHPAVKHVRNLVSIANELLGRPICSAEELAERRAPTASVVVPTPVTPAAPPQAPVLVYFDGKDHRTKAKVEELLRGHQIVFQVLDVSDDEAERSWVTTASKLSEFPIVVIAGTPVGGLGELTQLDVSGGLKPLVFGSS